MPWISAFFTRIFCRIFVIENVSILELSNPWLQRPLPPGPAIGIAIQNIGPHVEYMDQNQRDPLPQNLRLGLAWQIVDTDIAGVLISADIQKLLVKKYKDGSSDVPFITPGSLPGINSNGNPYGSAWVRKYSLRPFSRCDLDTFLRMRITVHGNIPPLVFLSGRNPCVSIIRNIYPRNVIIRLPVRDSSGFRLPIRTYWIALCIVNTYF
jgi:hypothetical protein